MEKAVVVRDARGRRCALAWSTATMAQALALKDWIACAHGGPDRALPDHHGRARGAEAAAGRGRRDSGDAPGFAEAQADFRAYGDQHRVWGEPYRCATSEGAPARMRYNLAESPLAALARRRDKDGEPFLAPDLVAAGERLREDFELAQMGPRVAQNWDRFLTAGDRGGFRPGERAAEGPSRARDRVAAALRDLGPGLGDVVLRCCCFLEGLETAEKRMGWSARSGKIVLRIALQRLKRHYDEAYGGKPPMIG